MSRRRVRVGAQHAAPQLGALSELSDFTIAHLHLHKTRLLVFGITITGMPLQEFTTRSAAHEPVLSAAPQPSPQNFAFGVGISRGLAKIARR